MNRHCLLITAGILLFLLFSCDMPEDYFFDNNRTPIVGLKSETGYFSEITASHKLSLGLNYTCVFRYSDDQAVNEIALNNISGNGTWDIADSTFYYLPDTTGQHIIELIFTDSYEASASCKINLNVFWNYPPVAHFTYVINNSIITVDASESYDQDAQYGGYLKAYKYYLDGKEYVLNSPSFSQNIDPEMIHIVKLQVQDNDNEWSGIVSDIVAMNP